MLEALQASGPASFLRSSFYLYPLLNALHILSIGALVTSALLMDLRVLGLGRRLAAETVIAQLRPVALMALAAALFSGLLLFSVQPLDYAGNPAFRIKLLLLVAALANAAVFTFLRLDRRGGRLSALLSILLWLGVLVAGRFIGFVL
ncbi:MAG TPA: hypothetical protein VGN80_17175 [Devosiaceae bacterium]|nr:hypothetical protein [Devosiaceae bacterium]